MNIAVWNQISKTGIVAILRGIESAVLTDTLDALYEGGIRCVEITLNTKGALGMIEQAKNLYGDRMCVGGGTVLDEDSARLAILAGADFVLSPTLSLPVISMCSTYNCLPIPGVFTPSEALEAWRHGAPIVKVFPCGSVGPSYIKDLKGPLPQIPMMPVGGVSLDTAEAFFQAGAMALGTGSSLFDPKLAKNAQFDVIRDRAAQFLKIAAAFR